MQGCKGRRDWRPFLRAAVVAPISPSLFDHAEARASSCGVVGFDAPCPRGCNFPTPNLRQRFVSDRLWQAVLPPDEPDVFHLALRSARTYLLHTSNIHGVSRRHRCGIVHCHSFCKSYAFCPRILGHRISARKMIRTPHSGAGQNHAKIKPTDVDPYCFPSIPKRLMTPHHGLEPKNGPYPEALSGSGRYP